MNLFLAAVSLASVTLAAAPFQNPDFQSGYSQVLTLSAGDTRLPGWEIGGDGSVVWDDGSIRFPGPAPKSEWIQQTFDTVPGQTYRIVFGLFHQGDGGGPSAIKSTVTGATGEVLVVQTNWAGNITGTVGYTPITVEFNATTTASTLRFAHEYSDGATREARIDNVQLFNLSAGGSLSTALFPGVFISGQVGLS